MFDRMKLFLYSFPISSERHKAIRERQRKPPIGAGGLGIELANPNNGPIDVRFRPQDLCCGTDMKAMTEQRLR